MQEVIQMNDATCNDILDRIRGIYSSSTPEEKSYLRKILEEISDTGHSPTYEQIWLEDFKEIPVTIDTFIESETYLGKTNRCGKAVYPFWRKELRRMFDAGNKYHEWVLTGATRIGKSSTAITGTAYMLYRLMCLRDPQKFFGKKDISKFSILFFNITKDLAKGVAFREFNDTLKASPWFNAHGTFSRSDRDFYYIPEGGKIVIDYGSDASHALGQQVFVGFCVVGSTVVITDAGNKRIDSLVDKSFSVLQYDPNCNRLHHVNAKAVCTKYITQTVQVILSEGSIIEGTPEHLIMLHNGLYKALGDLTVYDVPMSFSDYNDVNIVDVKHIIYNHPVPVYDIVAAKPLHNFVIRSNSNFVLHNCDEINFSQAGVNDVNKAKAHMRETYNTISARVKGTFKHGGEVFGKLFAVSSKRSDSDFMESYVQEQLAAGAGDHMMITDAPQWEVLPPETFSKEKFYIAVGDRHHRGFVIPDNQCFPEALDDLKQQGYTILTPPVDMRSDFLADFEIALRDLAGIANVGALSFITQESLTLCINKNRRNPFYNDILQIGVHDAYTIEEFFHEDAVLPEFKHTSIYIHLDLSLNGDRTGISGCGITNRKDVTGKDGSRVSLPFLTHMFSVAIEAPRGDKIPYSKILAFICWLRDRGYDIPIVSRDQFQSEYIGQQLEQEGFDSPKISLDRTPDGYIALRDILIDQRVDMLDSTLLQDELVHLQRDSVTGKVDHPVGGGKDLADSFAGCIWDAILQNPGTSIPIQSIGPAILGVNKSNRSNHYGNSVMSTLASMYKR